MGWIRWNVGWVWVEMAVVIAGASCDADDEDGAAESAAHSDGSDSDTNAPDSDTDAPDSDGPDSDTASDEGCQPGGLAEPGADVVPVGSYTSSIVLLSPGSHADGGRADVRFGMLAGETGLPPREELAGFVNGCPIDGEPPEGDEVFFRAFGDDVPVDVVAGGRVTIEMRHGDDVLLRRTAELPAALPELTSPAAGAAIEPSLTLAWTPLGLDALAAESVELGATAWIRDSGSGGTDGFLDLVDADGTATWFPASAQWSHVELQARVEYDDRLSLTLSHYQRVNEPQ